MSPNSGPASLAAHQHTMMMLPSSKWKRKVYNMSPNNNGRILQQMNYAGPYVKQRIGRHQKWT
eukprot:10949828-Ditylum_brightwellii.AAC.1